MKVKIRVANPVSARLTFISVKAAERYVARGRARWQNAHAIQFIDETHDRYAAQNSWWAESAVGYDRIGRMTLEQIEGIPVIGDPVKLFTRF